MDTGAKDRSVYDLLLNVWFQDGKLNRFYKMSIALVVMFLVTRSPVDILQLMDIIHTSKGNSITNRRPDQLGTSIITTC